MSRAKPMSRLFTLRLSTIAVAAATITSSFAQTPLIDMVSPQLYNGQQGGLYFNYNNNRPPFWQNAVLTEANQVVPRDFAGNVLFKGGSIGFCSIGMSNTFQEWTAFTPLAQTSGLMDPQVVLVNGAQGGMDLVKWGTGNDPTVYPTLAARVSSAGLSNAQIQVVWVKQSLRQPALFGAWPMHLQTYMKEMRLVLQRLKIMFPNLRIAYVSSRIYAGWATVPLSPEPYAYEQAFAVRQLIKLQATGDPTLNWLATSGPVKCPIICWGPYMWADGLNPRSDGLQWFQTDFVASDGTHPSPSGRTKVANMMLKFFAFDSTCGWFQP
jgi:hypothetical protein